MTEIRVEGVDRELSVEIAQFIFPVFCPGKAFRKFFKISLVIRAVVIDAFVNTQVLTVFDWLKGVTAVGSLELKRSSHFFASDKGLTAELAFELSTPTGIIIDYSWGASQRGHTVSAGMVRVLPF